MTEKPNPVIQNVRTALGRHAGEVPPARPAVLPARQPGPLQAEIDLFIDEVTKLSGCSQRLSEEMIDEALHALVINQQIRKAVVWSTPKLIELRIEARLRALDVALVPPAGDKFSLAACDLGVTEADFALPETGTLGLLSSADKPRQVSLLPRVHLAILQPAAFQADLEQVFILARQHHYLILITGPSRTSDIELTTTLGMHGPQALYAWILDQD